MNFKILLKILPVLFIMILPIKVYSEESYYIDKQFEMIFKTALENNNELRAIIYEMKSHNHKRIANLFPPDPMTEAMIGRMNVNLTVTQNLKDPLFYASRFMMENSGSKSTQAKYKIKKGKIIYELKKEYLNLYLNYERIKILEKNLDILDSLEDQILSKLKTGSDFQNRILMVQIEREQIKDKLNTIKNNVEINKTNIFSITGKEVVLKTNIKINETVIENLADNLNNQVINSPKYLFANTMVKKNNAKRLFEISKVIPDASIGADINIQYNNSEMPMVMLMAMINVPIFFPKNILDITSASNKYKASLAMTKEVENKLRSELNKLIINLKNNERSYNLYKNVIRDKADQNVNQIISQFSTYDNYNIIYVFEAYRKLLEVDLKIIELKVNRELAIAGLEKFYGMKISEIKKHYSDNEMEKENE